MLVLKRKKNESIIINDDTHISIQEIGPDWVKLSIEAPKTVSILRNELLEAANTNKESSTFTKSSLDKLKSFLSSKDD